MKDKNKFTLKIVLVILLAVALIATLISCCVLATKGKLSTQASCDNNQTAFSNERPDLDCCATAASSLETDYIPVAQADTNTVYYGIYVPDNEKNTNADFTAAYDTILFNYNLTSDSHYNYNVSYYKGKSGNSSYVRIRRSGAPVSFIVTFGKFENEFLNIGGFRVKDINADYVQRLDIYLRVSPLENSVLQAQLTEKQNQIDTLTAEKTALQKQVNDLTAEKTVLQAQLTEKQGQIDTLTAEKAALQTQVNNLTADKTALQAQVTEKQNQIDTLTAEKAALQTQVNNLTADKTALQAQLTEKQNQIDTLTAEKTALRTQVNDLTAKNTDLQNRLDKLLSDNYFCKFETVVGGTYIRNGLPDIGFSNGANGVFSRTPFANGQKGKIHNTLYLDWDLIRPNGGSHEGEKVSFKNTFYIYGKKNETVTFNGLLDFVEYSIRNFDKDKGYPILMTGKEDTDSNITFRLVDYNADCMKEVVISDRTYKAGYDRGHANGVSDATQSGHIFESSTSFLKSIFTDMGKLLDIKVFGNVTVGTLIGIPLILLVVMAVLKLVRG